MNDLDARVAALIEKFTAYRYLRMYELEKHKAEFEQSLRAELQKPALHEPYLPCSLSWGGFNLYGDAKSIAKAKSMLHDSDTVVPALRDAITELQGRAQPAAPVELPVVAWFYECADGTTLARTKDDKPVDDGEPLVKLSDAQAAVAAAGRTPS